MYFKPKSYSLNEFGYKIAWRWPARQTSLFAKTTLYHCRLCHAQTACILKEQIPGEICKAPTSQPIESRNAVEIVDCWNGKLPCFSSYKYWWSTPCMPLIPFVVNNFCLKHQQNHSSKVLEQVLEGMTELQEIKRTLKDTDLGGMHQVHVHPPPPQEDKLIIYHSNNYGCIRL